LLEEPCIGGEFVGVSTRAIKLAKDLGYAEVELMVQMKIAEEAIVDIRAFLSERITPRYKIRLSSSIPEFIYTLVSQECLPNNDPYVELSQEEVYLGIDFD